MTVLHGSELEILGTFVVLREVKMLEQGFMVEVSNLRGFFRGIKIWGRVFYHVGGTCVRTRVRTGGV